MGAGVLGRSPPPCGGLRPGGPVHGTTPARPAKAACRPSCHEARRHGRRPRPAAHPRGVRRSRAAVGGRLRPRRARARLEPRRAGVWHIESGQALRSAARTTTACGSRRPARQRPDRVRRLAESAEGDLKAEYWGDGAVAATGALLHERDELPHHPRRLEEQVPRARAPQRARRRPQGDRGRPDSDDPREKPVDAGQIYHFKVERKDGKTVKWSVDGNEMLLPGRPEPLVGRRARPFRLQRLGREGLLRQREGGALPH